jgi:hypothetical protein
MSTRIEMMLRDAERDRLYGDQSRINAHILGILAVLAEEIDAIRARQPAPASRMDLQQGFPITIDAGRAVALADAVRAFLYGTGVGSQNQVSRATLESALAMFESSK